ncbi:hypothetical protein [Anditalea andensis]|uniref:Thioredoxin-like fold domain-containing protein n=1 Tax=Anditalea andensis TaxID=1048983 RepID=A0A074LHL7_9BACT|nr:hypothetical protein [Anditalea andensis]KEO73287.1 hypothetical protein EL17_13135 [Anditalea andensis]
MNHLYFCLVLLLMSGCHREEESSDRAVAYFEELTHKTIRKDVIYFIVSDYGCSSCKEDVYAKAETGNPVFSFIITDPRNVNILKDRFATGLELENIFIDSRGLNKKKRLIFSTPMVLWYSDHKWALEPYDMVNI